MSPRDCPKFRYMDRASAEAGLAKLKRVAKKNRARREKAVYQCERCGFWHLTSQERR